MSWSTDFASQLTDPLRAPIAAPAITVFAHPDDETIACGAQLGRFADLRLVLVTDGAPENLLAVRRRGFSSPRDYSQARIEEFQAALGVAGVATDRLLRLGFTDGMVVNQVARLAKRLAELLVGAELVITHCYEGGHTDHDAVALAVHAACDLLRNQAGHPPRIVEAPLYNLRGGRWTPQRLPSGGSGQEAIVTLTPGERARKRRMIDCYASQGATLSRFDLAVERFRIDPRYDFSRLPNRGRLLYEGHWAAMSGRLWLQRARSAVELLEQGAPSGRGPTSPDIDAAELPRAGLAAGR